MRKLVLLITIAFFGYTLFTACNSDKKSDTKTAEVGAINEEELHTKAKAIFKVLDDKMPGADKDTPALVALGKKLYFETKLSSTGTQSCNSCHNLNGGNAGVDNMVTSEGAVKGNFGNRNSPTTLNAGFHFVQFWDGRAIDLKEQAKGPILNPVEMGMKDEKTVVKVISSVPEYKTMFAEAYSEAKDKITYDNLANAIAAFERTLVSKSRFDDYLAGDKNAINSDEKKGMALFMESGCNTCHGGALLGGNMYQKMGLINPYSNIKDLGRFEVTKNEADKFMFKVPSLRNVGKTAPYFHDGAVKDLNEAVKQMAWMQLNKKLTDAEISSIVKFLISLSDKRFDQNLSIAKN